MKRMHERESRLHLGGGNKELMLPVQAELC